MVDLAARLRRAGHDPRSEIVAGTPQPALLAALFELERLLIDRLRPSGADLVDDPPAPPADAEPGPDLVVDLSTDPRPRPGSEVWTVRYDDALGEDALLAAAVGGTAPRIEIVDLADGRVLERALPSTETASGVRDIVGVVGIRIGTLLAARLDARRAGRTRPEPPALPTSGARSRSPIAAMASLIASTIALRIYRLSCHPAHWRVGWRRIDGPGVGETGDLSGPGFTVIPDPGHHLYADPFIAVRDGETAVFVEDLDHGSDRAVISAIPFGPQGPIGPARPVLTEPWHLSYPSLIEEAGELYMIPESSSAGDVALYRCVAFPDRWERIATLLDDIVLSDATVFRRDGRWWMLGTVRDEGGGWSDTLSIHVAPRLTGPWRPHPVAAPLVDRSSARPAGAVFEVGDRLFRPVQDCTRTYGGALALAEITRLDEENYAQVVRRVITPGCRQWPGRRIHTLNRIGSLEVIDGAVLRPKSNLLAGIVQTISRPRSAER
jgi:hypothetical protein